ncbi:MAG TPA: hypothetical protein VNG33_00655, partial [Polyangiaceae bacterium]|nr:hypothetical protein [Polyangiaceae bacterium]
KISAGTRELVDRLLQRSPDDRLQSAAELVAHIDDILGYSPAASVAFAPVSGQGAALRKSPAAPGVAFANTVVGDALPPVPSVSPLLRLKTALEPAWATSVSLAKRRIAVGAKQVPLGAIGGALLALPLLLVLAFSAVSGGTASQAAPSGSAVPAAPVDDDMAELMKRAEGGEPTALAELLGRAAEAKLAPAFQALGRGYFKIGQLDAGLRAYRSGGKLDPKLGDSNDVLADLRRGLADPKNEQLTLEVASVLGAGGADFLYDVYDDNRAGNANLSKQAKALLDTDSVRAHASAALKVALDLPEAKKDSCAAVKKLLPRLQESGDARVSPTLKRLAERRGCGFLGLGDCFSCLRSANGKDFAAAQKAVAERPAPRAGQ